MVPKIISLYAADTELVLRLGARDSLIGVSRQESYRGPETEGWVSPPAFSIRDDVEKFISAAPSLVLARPQHLNSNPGLFERLQKNGVKIWSGQCLRAEDLYDFWTDLGRLLGRENKALAMIADFKKELAPFELNAKEKLKKPGVFLESIHKDLKTFTSDSIPIWLLTLAGGRNIASDASAVRKGQIVANYGPEKLLAKSDEVEIYLSQQGPMNSISLEEIKEREIFRVLPAFKNGRVYRVPEEYISRPTPSLVEGLRLMKEKITETNELK
jgi:iron complex transport system substrate-binding protein